MHWPSDQMSANELLRHRQSLLQQNLAGYIDQQGDELPRFNAEMAPIASAEDEGLHVMGFVDDTAAGEPLFVGATPWLLASMISVSWAILVSASR